MFPFTFKFPVPEIVNPFTTRQVMPKTRSPSPVIVSRKRARVSDIDLPSIHHEVDTQERPPPVKRRRGLAGSIVSTALSAALFGTAVGLTVFRLWRGRGKHSPALSSEPHTATEQLPPPPPYQEADTERLLGSTSPKSSRKHRSGAGSSKRSYHRQRPTRTRAHILPALLSPTQAELDSDMSTVLDVSPEPANEVDQMDWIGDKLSSLIAEGSRALGREIVVMSDSKEDEVDDGSGAWEDFVPASSSSSTPRTHRRRAYTTTASTPSSSQRRRRAQQPDPGSISQIFSASTASLPLAPSTPRRSHHTGLSLDSSPASAGRLWTSSEDINSFDSPELRESMEKARQRALMMRSSRSGGPDIVQ